MRARGFVLGLTLFAAALLASGCGAMRQLSKQDVDRAADIEAKIAKAESMDAADCAPKELAQARAQLNFARHEGMEFHDRAEVDEYFAKAEAMASTLMAKTEPCWQAKQKKPAAAPPADSDGDGVPDYKDRCPDTKKGASVDAVGCPLDTDGDGVADYEDKCPNTPRGAPVDASGCFKDSDGDGLTDWDEMQKYRTDPNNPDTDGDGLKDGEEVNKYGTNPLHADTDDDGLKDGDEVHKYKTDPKNADTDGGSVNDGLEVIIAKTNPLDPKDDVKELACVELQINFDFDSDVVKPMYFPEIERVANYLKDFEELQVTIQGHTDDVGTVEYNLDLSLRRARNVMKVLDDQYGIAGSRLKAEGYGEGQPIAPNDTEAGREKNRRIYALIECK